MEIQHYTSRAALMSCLAGIVASELQQALEEKGRATLAVPGGTTPGPFFTHLRQSSLDWEAITVLLTDERCVPDTSERSNARLLRQTLLLDHAARACFVPLYETDGESGAGRVANRADIDPALPLDVCVLGMGEDMHTASLFPGANRLDEALSKGAPPLLPMSVPGVPESRLTLTAPALLSACCTHLLMVGAAKKQALERATADLDAIKEGPVRLILRDGLDVTVHYAD